MLITVVYNDGQILFCNADCVVGNLLYYVKKQTGNLDCEVVDLADETGMPNRKLFTIIHYRLMLPALRSVISFSTMHVKARFNVLNLKAKV